MSSGYFAPTIGASGLSVPTYQEILADNIQQFLRIYGANEYVGEDSAIYQFISVLSLKQSDTLQALVFAYNQSSPATAIGAGLDRLVKLNGLARLPYTYSTAVLTITGVVGTVITNGAAQDASGNIWLLTTPVTIPSGGSIQVLGTCTTPGNVTAEVGAIDIIATPQGGWTSVTNASPANPGTPIETDSQLRARQAISVALPSKTMLDGTVADLLAIPGVTRLNVLENYTSGTDIYGNPPHSITCVVEGGTNQEIAEAIYLNRGIGCYTNGDVDGSSTPQTVTVVITDPDTGYPLNINFLTPSYLPIFVTMNVHLLAGGTSATLAAIQSAIVTYLDSLEIGENVVYSELWGAALNARSNPDMPTFSIHSVYSGFSASPVGTSDLTLLFYQVSEGISGNVVINSV
jgi:uncharacterized phage protein gp47/JayE